MAHKSNKIVIKRELLVAQLYKAARGSYIIPPTTSGQMRFCALGYYDNVTFYSSCNSVDLADYCDKCNNVYTESVVLIPVSDASVSLDKNRLMGVLSFILTDEADENKIQTIAQKLEKLHENDSEIMAKAFLTTGASSIAVLSICENFNNAADALKRYFIRTQSFCAREEACVYCFSIPLLYMEESILEGPLNNDIHCFDAISITIARKLETSKSFDRWIKELKEQILIQTSSIIKCEGLISGTDDYMLLIEHVSPYTLARLFFDDGVLAKENSEYYDATSTTLVFSEKKNYRLNTHFNKKHIRYREKTAATSSNSSTTIVTMHSENEEMLINIPRECRHFMDAFVALRDNPYTRWIYQKYRSIIDTFNRILQLQSVWDVNNNTLLLSSRTFFDNLYSMLESLLNTSVYFTDSPGFRKIENNIVPRFILASQTIINEYAKEWDERATIAAKRDREKRDNVDSQGKVIPQDASRIHTFMLAPHTGNTVYATMLFEALPPDLRLIIINLPIRYALRPVISFPLLLHEVGHYIGVRDRKEDNERHGRENYFIRMISCLYCRLILERYIHRLLDAQAFDHVRELLTNQVGTKGQQYFFAFLALSLSEYEQDLNERVWELYKKSQIAKVESINLEIENKNDTLDIELLLRKRQALEQGYFSEMTPLVKSVFIEEVRDYHSLIEIYRNNCKERINADPQDYQFIKLLEGTIHFIEETFSEENERIIDTLYCEDPNEHNLVEEVQSMLSEVAADVFMIKSLNMNTDDYLLLFFEQYIINNDYGKLEAFVRDFDGRDELKTRLLVICNAMNDFMESDEKYENIKCRISGIESRKKIENNRGISVLDEGGTLTSAEIMGKYMEMKKNIMETINNYNGKVTKGNTVLAKQQDSISVILNPYFVLSEYAEQIMQDKRYTKMNTMEKIRKLYTISKQEETKEIDACELYRTIYMS